MIKMPKDLLEKLKGLVQNLRPFKVPSKYLWVLLGLVITLVIAFLAIQEPEDDDNELVAKIQKGPIPKQITSQKNNPQKDSASPTLGAEDLTNLPTTPSFDGRVAIKFSSDTPAQGDRFLPCIGKDGEKPYEVYKHTASPTDQTPEHPFSIVISGLGDDPVLLNQVIETLPQTVALGFLTDSQGLIEGHTAARNKGFETLLMLPLESMGYPLDDAGPNTLLTGEGQDSWVKSYKTCLSQVTGYVGIMNYLGSRFIRIERAQQWLLKSLNDMGLIYAESFQGIPSNTSTVAKDLKTSYINLTPALRGEYSLKETLASIEKDALKDPTTVGHITLTHASQLPILQTWLSTLSAKKMGIVPLTYTWKRIQEQQIHSPPLKGKKLEAPHAKSKP